MSDINVFRLRSEIRTLNISGLLMYSNIVHADKGTLMYGTVLCMRMLSPDTVASAL